MSASAVCLLGMILWAIVLTFVLVGARAGAVIGGGGPQINTFSPDGTDLPQWGHRITRAHANTLENLAIVVGLIGYAMVTEQTAVTDGLALVVLGARLVQSIIHILSTSLPMVLARATAFSVQMIIFVIWAIGLWGGA